MTREGDAGTLPKVVLTNHAVERYQERAKPAMFPDGVRREMENLLLICECMPSAEPPPCIIKKHESTRYLEVSPGIWLILEPRRDCLSAVTTVFDGIWTDGARLNHNRMGQNRRKVKRRKGENGKRQHGRGQKLILARDHEDDDKKQALAQVESP